MANQYQAKYKHVIQQSHVCVTRPVFRGCYHFQYTGAYTAESDDVKKQQSGHGRLIYVGYLTYQLQGDSDLVWPDPFSKEHLISIFPLSTWGLFTTSDTLS